jgi:undecaprenyl-diphosphatase
MADSIKNSFEEQDYESPVFVAPAFSALDRFKHDVGTGNLVLALVGILSAVAFFLLLSFVQSGATSTFESSFLLYLHGYAAPLLDQSALAICAMVTVVSVFFFCLLLYRRQWRDAAFWFAATAGGAMISNFVKRAVHRHRPELWDLIAPEGTGGFPSGHAMHSMAIALALLLVFRSVRSRPMLVAACAAFVALVALCRMYLGLHYPSDILGGWTLSAAWVCMLGVVFNRFGKKTSV